MTNTPHTPGPWGCTDTSYHAHDYRLTKPDGSPLPVNAPFNDHSEQRANARLIAAAPDLLAALVYAEQILRKSDMAPHCEDGCGHCDAAKAARAAIAKAKGA